MCRGPNSLRCPPWPLDWVPACGSPQGSGPPSTSGRRYNGNITGEETKHRQVKSGPEPKQPRDTRQVKSLGSDVWLGAGNNEVA